MLHCTAAADITDQSDAKPQLLWQTKPNICRLKDTV